jgi:hypothetical protein
MGHFVRTVWVARSSLAGWAWAMPLITAIRFAVMFILPSYSPWYHTVAVLSQKFDVIQAVSILSGLNAMSPRAISLDVH